MKTRCYLDDKEVTWPVWEIETRLSLPDGVGFLKVSKLCLIFDTIGGG